MKSFWDLKKLYSTKEEFYYDMTLIRDKIKKLCQHREIKIDGFSLYDLMTECFSIREMNSKTLLFASLNYYLDINNDSNIKIKKQAEELDQFVLNETSFIDELLYIFDEEKLDLLYKENNNLDKYKFYIDTVRKNSKHIISNSSIDNYTNTINNNLIKYNNMIKDMDFGVVSGINLNNSNIGIFLTNENREIRKDVFKKLNKSYFDKRNDYFNIFSEIISLRKKIVLEKKYSSVLESELYKEDISFKYLDNLINGVNNNIHLMNRYLKLKCDFLKIRNPHFYDINLFIASCNDKFDIDSAIDIIKNALSVLGDKYIECVDYLINNNHLDLECNDKKHPSIIFSWNTYSFMNYKDRYIDLKNLAHELGHIVNCYLSLNKQIYIYSDIAVFIDEVASLVNEIMVNEYLYRNAENKDEKIFYLTKIIENFISQVYRQTMYTEFENIIYEKDELDIDFIDKSYLSLVKKYYGNVIKVDDDISCEWMRNGHLFRWSYYVYKYASNYLLAFNVIHKLREDSSKYLEFLAKGSCCSNEDLFKELDIDIYDNSLFDNSFNLLASYIDELKILLRDKK